MLAIRLQRTGRSGHAQFRVIVQDSRFSPKRGRVVSYLGNYDPHTKTAVIDGQKASQYLQNGARPSDRVARLFKEEGIKLPAWVKLEEPRQRTVRNPEKRRSTAPAAAEAIASEAKPGPTADEPTTETPAAESPAADTPAETAAEEPADEAPADAEPTTPNAPTDDTPGETEDTAKPEAEKPADS